MLGIFFHERSTMGTSILSAERAVFATLFRRTQVSLASQQGQARKGGSNGRLVASELDPQAKRRRV
jgi:hypothetical protein